MTESAMNKPPKLPLGDASFESIRSGDLLYVDKTRHIFQMVDEGKYYFLSRPRRFGKSLTVSTLRCLFEGKKDLFEGLWIAEHGDWNWKPHPVIVIDFNEIPRHRPEVLERTLSLNLKQTGQHYGVSLQTEFIETQFQELILGLEKRFSAPVAVLIDEYDKPIIDHLGKGDEAIDVAKRNRDILKSFFGVLKGANVTPCLRFVFLTGVSKFSRVSIFSELNNLNDVTMMASYADMFGYTQKELEENFQAHIDLLAEQAGASRAGIMKKLERHYNGYRFSRRDVRVYNPFSILSAFVQKDFKNFWFETGTPTFLVNLLTDAGWHLPEIEGMKTTETAFSTYDLENLKPEALLFQTGYATIKDVAERVYTFDYPNQEVKTGFLETLFYACAEGMKNRSQFAMLAKHLEAENVEAFMEIMRAVFASIPYTLESKRDEAYFHTLFYLMVSASGVNASSEVLTCDGRIDLAMAFRDKIYIIEFKCNQSADVGLKQIREKGYADRYRGRGGKIILMGINFDTEARNVGDWKVEDGV